LHRSRTLSERALQATLGFARKFQIRDDELIGQLVNDIMRFKRAATGESNAKGFALALGLPRASRYRGREFAT
jgi:hypothetical protein